MRLQSRLPLFLAISTPSATLSLLPCSTPFVGSPTSKICGQGPSTYTALFIRKLTRKSSASPATNEIVRVLPSYTTDDDEDDDDDDEEDADDLTEEARKKLTPKQVTLALRERAVLEDQELKRLWRDSDGLRSQIKGLEEGISFIELASECFGRFIVDGKMESIVFPKPTPESESEAIEMYRTLAAVKNDPTGNMKNIFDKCLTRHGFRLESVTIDDDDRNDFLVSLVIVPGEEHEASIEEVISVISLMANGDSKEPGKAWKQDPETTVRTTLGARQRKIDEDNDVKALRKRIQLAEEKIERNEWEMKYIALAREAFARYYNDGELEDITFTADTSLPVFATLERLWEKSREDRDIFNRCLSKHGLKYVKISYTENKTYYLTLSLLTEDNETALSLSSA